MKRIIIRLLAAIGLVPAGRHAVLARQAHEFSKEARVWKKHATKSVARTGKLEQQLQQQVQLLKEMRAAKDRQSSATQRQDAEWTAMQTRLVETERALRLAREHLMAIEVKLDILEGAANVLDARTRSSIERQSNAPLHR